VTKLAAGPPSYPTSSRKGPQNWDKINELDADDEEVQDADRWFQKLYAGGTEEQKRAMMNSFVESNGTTLSTDWGDVGSRKVDTNPPDGVEAKKWES
jgi:suppressor of G2 allele of SKP1